MDLSTNLQPQSVMPKLYLIIMDPIGKNNKTLVTKIAEGKISEMPVERYVHCAVHTSIDEARNVSMTEVKNNPLTARYVWQIRYESVWEASRLEAMFAPFKREPTQLKNDLMIKIIKEKDVALFTEEKAKATFSEAELKYLEEQLFNKITKKYNESTE